METFQMKNDIKKIGDAILAHVRSTIREAAKGDADFEFKLNRWVFTRLQEDGRKQSRLIKQKLWDSGIRQCQACGKKFSNIKGVEIHRKDSSLGYSVENCDRMTFNGARIQIGEEKSLIEVRRKSGRILDFRRISVSWGLSSRCMNRVDGQNR